MKNCPKCNNECDDNAIICPKCGFLFNLAAQQPEQPAQQGFQPQPPVNSGPQYQQGFQQPGYGQPQQPFGAPPAVQYAKNNGVAVAAFVLGLLGTLCNSWMLGVVGVILGFVGKNQIRNSKGLQKGDGLALAGIILGFIGTVLSVLTMVFLFTHPGFVQDIVRQYVERAAAAK